MACRGNACVIRGLLALLILACPACRLLGELSSSGRFREDAGPSTGTRWDADSEDDAPNATTEADAGDALGETAGEDAASASTHPATSLDTGTSVAVGVDAAVDSGTGSDASTATGSGSGYDTSTAANTSSETGTATASGTGALTATAILSSTGSQTGTNTPTDVTTVSTTNSRTATTSQTVTPTTTATRTSTPSSTGSQTATASQTATHTATATSTSTPSSTGSQSATASQTVTASSSSTGTGSTAVTGTQTGTATTSAPISVSSVALNKTTAEISTGQTQQLTASVQPADATNRNLTWSTGDASVARVSTSGLVSAIAVGNAVITVTTADGGKTATCTVTVVIAVASVAVSPTTATLAVGQTVPLAATVSPADATNQNLTWSSNNIAVATVSGTGSSALVSAVGPGSAKIVVSAQDGKATATCLITVAVLSTQWARGPTAAGSSSAFLALAADGANNIYAAGSMSGSGSFAFGNSVTATGLSTTSQVLLVKYDSTGTAQWARTVVAGEGGCAFTGVATDAAGNLFAVGTITGPGPYDFGNSVLVTGGYAFGSNLLLVMYNASGAAQWGRSVETGPGASSYAAIAIDPSGGLHAAGTIVGNSRYDLGNGKTVSGAASAGTNALLVKYGADGTAQWARSTISAGGPSAFGSVAIDGAGNSYAAGYAVGTLALSFASAVTATGTSDSNALLVQYDSGGTAQWAQTATSGGNDSSYAAAAASSSGSVFAAGLIYGNTANTFATAVKVAGAFGAGTNVLALKYDASGAAQWGHSATAATTASRFVSFALDKAGYLYGAGLLTAPGTYDFGNLNPVSNPSSGGEVLLVMYDSSGTCRAVRTATSASASSSFSAVTADSAAGIYAAGTINGASAVDFGNSITATGAYPGGDNAVLVKYR